MGEYSVEQIRDYADACRLLHKGPVIADILYQHADLREQIERAREGVTDEVVRTAVNVWFGDPQDSPLRRGEEIVERWMTDMRAAIQAVAHLLPSERGGVARMLPVELADVADEWYQLCERAPHAEKIKISGSLAEAIVKTVCKGAHPPAQAAGVECPVCKGRRERFNDVHNRMMTCPDCKGTGRAPTAEPVAQGEAVLDRAVLAYRIGCTGSVEGHNHRAGLAEVIAVLAAQPRAVPDGWEIDSNGKSIAIRCSDGRKAILRSDRGLTYADRVVFDYFLAAAPPSTPPTTGAIGENGNG